MNRGKLKVLIMALKEVVEEFMNVLEVVRKLCPEERLAYTNPL